MKKSVIIIGGGIAGLSTAYFLNKRGATVTVIDRSTMLDSSSCGNAGFLSMFEKSPFAYPGVFLDTARAALRGRSPMTITPPVGLDLLLWGLDFYRASRPGKFRRVCELLDHFGEEVFSFYQTISTEDNIDCEYHRDGFALLYIDQKNYQKKLQTVKETPQHYEILTNQRIESLFPLVQTENLCGGVLLKRNGHVNPERLIANLKLYLENAGVRFVLNEEISSANTGRSTVQCVSSAEHTYEADEFVLATGVDLGLTKSFESKLRIVGGRGYSTTFEMEEYLKPQIPALFSDVYTAITPRKHTVRVTGKIQFGRGKPDTEFYVSSLLKNLRRYTKPFSLKNQTSWSGFRPLTGNDLPYIGRDKRYQNISYAMGLGHLGINLGPIVGEILAELISTGQSNTENSRLMKLSKFYQG